MSSTYNTNDQLYFHEEILLLALREDDGKIEGKAQFEYQHLLAAALVAELLIQEKIEINDPKKLTIAVRSSSSTGNSLLDEALEKISKNKPRSATHWIQTLSNISNLQGKAAADLCNRGILAAEDGKIFFFFDKVYYPELNPKPEMRLISRLEKAIFGNSYHIDERTLILLSLLRKSELLKIPFDAKALKERRHHMKNICEGSLLGTSTQAAVQAAQTALMVATIIPAVTTTVITS